MLVHEIRKGDDSIRAALSEAGRPDLAEITYRDHRGHLLGPRWDGPDEENALFYKAAVLVRPRHVRCCLTCFIARARRYEDVPLNVPCDCESL